MFDIWQSISKLRQPCLMRAAPATALGADGVVQASVLRSIDVALWEDVESGLQEMPLPSFQEEVLYTDDKWLTTSALQKCIRRGHSDLAERYARSGIRIDADHTFRRLSVIALEDVGLGDLRLVASALAVLGDKRRRRSLGEERLAAHLARRMSRSVKSRSACEMLSLVEYDPSSNAIGIEFASRGEEALANITKVGPFASGHQLSALWLLYGTDRLPSRYLPVQAGVGTSGILKLMGRMNAPLIFHYIVQRTISRVRDSLALPYVSLSNLELDEMECYVETQGISEPEMVGAYPSEALDMHTREGRVAICELAAFLKQGGEIDPRADFRNLVFAAEGASVDRRLANPLFDHLSVEAMRLEVFGMQAPVEHLLEVIRGNIHTLTYFRRQAFVRRHTV